MVSILLAPFRALTGPPMESSPGNDVDRFQRDLEDRHGVGSTPTLLAVSHGDAIAKARSSYRLLLVVLHSEYHQDAEEFERDVFCSEAFRTACNDRYVVWGASVFSEEGQRAAATFRAEHFPFVAAYLCMPNRSDVIRVGIMTRDGERGGTVASEQDLPNASSLSSSSPLPSASVVSSWLNRVRQVAARRLDELQAEALRREEDRLMREEQDARYHEALAADRAKEEKAAIKAEQAELDEAVAMSQREARAQDLEEAKKRVLKAPEPHESSGTTIRLAFPDGTRAERTFDYKAPVSIVADYALVTAADLDMHDDLPDDLILRSAHPKVEFRTADPDAMRVSIYDAGLHPRAQLFVLPDVDRPHPSTLASTSEKDQEKEESTPIRSRTTTHIPETTSQESATAAPPTDEDRRAAAAAAREAWRARLARRRANKSNE